FGASTVVDETGAPIVLYHGTSKDKDFAAFNIGKRGAWFTTDPKEASAYASDNDSQNFIFRNGEYVATNTAARVIPAYVKIENPYTMTEQDRQRLNVENYAKAQAAFFDELRARGHDGARERLVHLRPLAAHAVHLGAEERRARVVRGVFRELSYELGAPR
ncbi:MAG: hypothetical protein ACK55I_38845, partial [bacterium]